MQIYSSPHDFFEIYNVALLLFENHFSFPWIHHQGSFGYMTLWSSSPFFTTSACIKPISGVNLDDACLSPRGSCIKVLMLGWCDYEKWTNFLEETAIFFFWLQPPQDHHHFNERFFLTLAKRIKFHRLDGFQMLRSLPGCWKRRDSPWGRGWWRPSRPQRNCRAVRGRSPRPYRPAAESRSWRAWRPSP